MVELEEFQGASLNLVGLAREWIECQPLSEQGTSLVILVFCAVMLGCLCLILCWLLRVDGLMLIGLRCRGESLKLGDNCYNLRVACNKIKW